jgi:chromosome segregation ATPase
MVIDTSELLRVYGEHLQAPKDKVRDRQAPDNVPSGISETVAVLTAQLEAAKERIAELKERAQSDQAERDRLLSILERQSRLLESQPPKKRGFFEFFTG